MKHFPFIGVLLGLLFLGGEGARAASVTLTNTASYPLVLELQGVDYPALGATGWTTDGFDPWSNPIPAGATFTLPQSLVGESFTPYFLDVANTSQPYASRLSFGASDPGNGGQESWMAFTWEGGQFAFVHQGQGYDTRLFVPGASEWQTARASAAGIDVSWLSSEAILDSNLSNLVQMWSAFPGLAISMLMLAIVGAITAAMCLFGLWTFLHWFYLRLRGRDLA